MASPARLLGVAAVAFLVALPRLPARASSDFASCLTKLRSHALTEGVSLQAFARFADGLEPNDAPKFLGRQPEFTAPIWDYLGGLVDPQRIADGRTRLREYSSIFSEIARRYAVPADVVAAVWGIESDYGRKTGKRPVLASLASLACYPSRRQNYFRSQFIAALRILQQGYAAPERFYGSWAGAFGQVQFMPTTFFASAVSLDGKRDIIGSIPDSLASIANFLRQHGWRPGQKWGFEVRLPQRYAGPSGLRQRRPTAFWSKLGVRSADGDAFAHGYVSLIRPAGTAGPAFFVTQNFRALTSYNDSESYGLAVGLLANRLDGRPPLKSSWPHRGMTRAQRRETQDRLRAIGYDVGNADGVMGDKSRAAIAAEESKLGFAANGWASVGFLKALRKAQQ